MGKKVKKEEKSTPEDVFEALLVESRQAATVVLMLSSPEEDVLAKACEAIYKFVDKCDENKKTLLDLGAVDHLLRLMQLDDRIVRRNACMALGTMTQHVDVRKTLRKKEEAIPTFVTLLGPEEDTVVHEFAALGLSKMAQDFSSKVTIYENDGLESLIRCLSSNDPDVQKNSLETIALMLQDYQSRTAIRDLNGFTPLFELLMNSEYAIIQCLCLVSLERATQDCENRAALRDLEVIVKLIDFVGHPEWSDLHTFAVQVLSNCLEDVESMQMIKENGGLKKLVAFITDVQPPEEEQNTGKKDKKGAASRAGKKGKKDDDDKHEKKDGMPGAGDSVVPTLPEVKMCAAKAIARAAKNSENRKILHEQEAEKMLILLLNHDDVTVQIAGAQALGIMSENLSSRESIGQWEGIDPLVKMLKHDNADVREAASLALANLTTSNMQNSQEVINKGGLDPLITMLSDTRELAVANAACVLTNMATEESMRADIQRAGVVAALIPSLKSSNILVQSKVSLAVAAFVCDAETREEFRNGGGLEPLTELLKSGNNEVQRSASWAVTICAVDEPTAIALSKLGALETLQDIQVSGTRSNRFADAALDKMLDSNLSAKYSLTGNIGMNNLICDGFYDAGQMRKGTHFLTLEDYCKQAVDQKRPILLVNAKPEKVNTAALPPQTDTEGQEKNAKSNVSGKGSRAGQKSGSNTPKSRAQREKEEKQREEELAAQMQREAEMAAAAAAADPPEFVPPSDPALLKMVEEVTESIMPLPSTKDQVVALAMYVSQKMGGSIERGQLANFSWELPLSQLKFELKSNVIPLGLIRAGIHCHRALLFKSLADRIAVNCTLVRGEYHRAWNVIMLTDDDDAPGAPKFPPKPYIVDLIHQPGRLMQIDHPDALSYQKLGN